MTGDLTLETKLITDTIDERTAGHGIDVGGVLLKGNDVYADEIYLDVANKDIRLYRAGADLLGIADAVQFDATLGVRHAPVDNYMIYTVMSSSETVGFMVDGYSNAYAGDVTNYALYVLRDVSTGESDSSIRSAALTFRLRNYRDVVADGFTFENRGVMAEVRDYGDITGEGLFGDSYRISYGLYGTAYCFSHDTSDSDNYVETYGVYYDVQNRPTVNKSACTLDSKNYGVWAKALTNPVITAGTFVAETYGAYVEGQGTTEGTQTVYGIRAKASGGDVNWSGYFESADVYIEQDLYVDGKAYIDELGQDLLPDANNTIELGSAALNFAVVHTYQVTSPSTIMLGQNVVLVNTKHFWPNLDNSSDLGTNTNEFRDLYLDGVAYIDTLQVHVALDLDSIDIAATSVSGLSAVIPVTVAGATKYIPVYDSYS